MKKGRILEIIWFVVILVLFIGSIKLLRSGELESQIASFGVLAPLTLIVLKASTLVVAPLGGTPLYVIAGVLFGTAEGFLYSLVGDVLGSAICFILGRKYGGKIVKFFVGERYFDKVLNITSLLGKGSSFMKARLALATIPELVAYAAGLSKINFWKFMILHNILYVPIDFILVFLGDQLASLSVKYIFLLYGVVSIVTLLGFWLLYKDYEKLGEM